VFMAALLQLTVLRIYIYMYIYIYIYIYVCVCVCVCTFLKLFYVKFKDTVFINTGVASTFRVHAYHMEVADFLD
jgi:hypothetical protein